MKSLTPIRLLIAVFLLVGLLGVAAVLFMQGDEAESPSRSPRLPKIDHAGDRNAHVSDVREQPSYPVPPRDASVGGSASSIPTEHPMITEGASRAPGSGIMSSLAPASGMAGPSARSPVPFQGAQVAVQGEPLRSPAPIQSGPLAGFSGGVVSQGAVGEAGAGAGAAGSGFSTLASQAEPAAGSFNSAAFVSEASAPAAGGGDAAQSAAEAEYHRQLDIYRATYGIEAFNLQNFRSTGD